MISLRIADIFTNLAEVKKAEPACKETIKSLMRAARTLRDDPGIVERILRGEGTGTLDGVDNYCFSLITEYLEKGEIGEYEEFSSSYSDELIRLIRITGLGRRRIFSIYDAFGIKDLDSLKSVFSGADPSGIAEASGLKKDILNPLFTGRINSSIEYLEVIKGRTPRWPAEFYARIMMEGIEKLREVKRVVFTGSMRRKKSLVGDIDFLLLPVFNEKKYDPGKSLEFLKKIAGLSFIRKLVSVKDSEGDISGLYSTVYEVDIEIIIASQKTWTWQLLKTTGSKKHLSLLEGFARENGQPDLESLGKKELASEEEIYGLLGLEYIPAELREGNDEIFLSSRKRLPELVKIEDIKGDLHIHSPWSDGLIEYSRIISSAEEMGYQYIAISDHSQSNFYGNGLDLERLLKKIDFIKDLREKYRGTEILMGAEIDIKKPEVFDYDPDTIRMLDIAIASLHSSFTYSVEQNTSRAVSALSKDYFDLLAHPTGIVFGNRAPIFMDIDRVIGAAAENGKALEINSYYMRLDLDEENARKAAAAGAKLAINTDSHRPGNMEMMQLGVDIARRAGLQTKDILNTMSIEELRDWRSDRKRKGQSL